MFAGFCAFLQLYATQPILPLFAEIFDVGKAAVGLTVTAAGIGVALGAPIAGRLADLLGRKRLIVWSAFLLALATMLTATSATLTALIFWRFWQGVFTPGVFAVTIAYINDEWAEGGAAAALSTYISATVLGGFSSRMIAGLVAASLSWQLVFVVLGVLAAAGAWGIAAWLPVERAGHRVSAAQGTGWAAARAHFANRRLVAAFAVGFCALFSLTSTFTYVTFYLADPPFHLQPAALGSIFVVYLAGAAVMPVTGRAIDRFGNRRALAFAIGAGVAGVGLTLFENLWLVALGLTVTCSGVFLAQASASGFVGLVAKENRALAAGMYATFYHSGGGLGAVAPAYFWSLGGWPACVAFIAGVQVLTVTLALAFWGDPGSAAVREAWATPPELE
jgi:MFS family permease